MAKKRTGMSVILPCNNEWRDTSKVEFENIAEGPQGEDRMTYKCPECRDSHTSTVYRKNIYD